MSLHIWSFQGECRGRNLERRCSTGTLIWQAGKNTPSASAWPPCVWRTRHRYNKPLPRFGAGGAVRDLGVVRGKGQHHLCCLRLGTVLKSQFSASLRSSLGSQCWRNSSLHTEQAFGGFQNTLNLVFRSGAQRNGPEVYWARLAWIWTPTLTFLHGQSCINYFSPMSPHFHGWSEKIYIYSLKSRCKDFR